MKLLACALGWSEGLPLHARSLAPLARNAGRRDDVILMATELRSPERTRRLSPHEQGRESARTSVRSSRTRMSAPHRRGGGPAPQESRSLHAPVDWLTPIHGLGRDDNYQVRFVLTTLLLRAGRERCCRRWTTPTAAHPGLSARWRAAAARRQRSQHRGGSPA